jgi:hypothetical protein
MDSDLDGDRQLGKIAVVGERELRPGGISGLERLGVVQRRIAGSGISHVPDANVANQPLHHLRPQHVGDQSHAAVGGNPLGIPDRHPGRLLTSVLKCDQPISE